MRGDALARSRPQLFDSLLSGSSLGRRFRGTGCVGIRLEGRLAHFPNELGRHRARLEVIGVKEAVFGCNMLLLEDRKLRVASLMGGRGLLLVVNCFGVMVIVAGGNHKLVVLGILQNDPLLFKSLVVIVA
jgi:hypothetical protein